MKRYVLSADAVFVYDSWDCYREVHWPVRGNNGQPGRPDVSRRRARIVCDRFNREHDEWMARGRVA